LSAIAASVLDVPAGTPASATARTFAHLKPFPRCPGKTGSGWPLSALVCIETQPVTKTTKELAARTTDWSCEIWQVVLSYHFVESLRPEARAPNNQQGSREALEWIDEP